MFGDGDDRADALLPATAPRAGSGTVGATINLIKTCIGTGMLALPYAFVQGGFWSSPALLAIGLWNWWNARQLVQVQDRLFGVHIGPQVSAFSAIAHAALGKYGTVTLDGTLIVILLGVCSSLQIQAAQLASAVCAWPYVHCVVVSAAALVPLVLLRSLDRLAVISAVGLAVLFIAMVAVGAFGMERYGWPTSLPEPLLATPSAAGFAEFFGITCFSVLALGLEPRTSVLALSVLCSLAVTSSCSLGLVFTCSHLLLLSRSCVHLLSPPLAHQSCVRADAWEVWRAGHDLAGTGVDGGSQPGLEGSSMGGGLSGGRVPGGRADALCSL